MPSRQPWTHRRWVDQSQPQTLQGAVVFSYLNAVLAIIYSLVLHAPFLIAFLLMALAAFGIANGRKLAYWGGVVLACVYLLGELALLALGRSLGGILDLLFAGILVVLLLHPDSRNYVRTWFR